MKEESKGSLAKSKVKIIDWDEALEQVGGDEAFLNEVLDDLIVESDKAYEDIELGIKEHNHNEIMKAAHRIKGSASYLCCENLRLAALDLQEAGHEAMMTEGDIGTDQYTPKYIKLFEIYKNHLFCLKNEIGERSGKKEGKEEKNHKK